MDSHSIAILEEELGLFGYFYPKNQSCDKTGKFSASSGWTNSKFSKKKKHTIRIEQFQMILNSVIHPMFKRKTRLG